ncbi:electron transport complex subunit RsxC [Paraglaciecola aquimarina]|uniref:Ion-translocating oxidoreductase complex subunit C n=1 Tax=Paraglaciecola algarum TaxID=3050085 RepID=A0ABS9D3X1_9ALTE|nr:electron transport complex subunit RsxC [Paraglaciecola sp. G1-23]MCF2946524.1 electron transport complex subunit RsxC [Paraglaciecola sp. G1-23]
MQTSYEQIVHKIDSDELWDFPGGIYPPERKEISNLQPIATLPIPEKLYVTVKQHKGVEGNLIVEVGQQVLKGQALSKSANPFAVPIHAPTSGKISAIRKHVSPHPSGIPELSIEIETDGQDTWTELSPTLDYQNQPKIDLLTKICDAGISGMGGAGFPSHIKLSTSKKVEFLIINGVECEPYITSDDRLMREHAWQIRQGIDVLTHMVQPQQVFIAIEKNKPEAIEALQIACRENPLYQVVEIPTKYPSGGEKQLIQILTNREVPAQGLPIDVGVISHNVGTCFAVADAIFSGKPLIQRVTTVTGEAVSKPANYWTLIGTPIKHILNECGYQASSQKQARAIIGGPMMGFTVTDELVPIIKTSNCVLVPADSEMAELNEQACIRCGACADVCPAGLLPQQLFWHAKAKELDKAQEYNLFDCIECGACAYVCPSEIPLVHYYRVAKADIRNELDEKQQADKARERFEKRAARLKAEQAARDEKHRLAAEARKQAMESKGNNAKDKIAAALARAKAKKQGLAAADSNLDTKSEINSQKTPPIESNDEPTQKHEIVDAATEKPSASSNQRVQAAIARAKAKKAAVATKSNQTPEITTEQEKSSSGSLNIENQDENIVESKPIVHEATKVSDVPRTVVQQDTKKPEQESVSPSHEENSDNQISQNIAEQKQAKVAAAVAKAKAKREAQKKAKASEIQITKPLAKEKSLANEKTLAQVEQLAEDPNNQQESSSKQNIEHSAIEDPLVTKKRRIAVAVAKAKAKRQAEKTVENSAPKENKEDKS